MANEATSIKSVPNMQKIIEIYRKFDPNQCKMKKWAFGRPQMWSNCCQIDPGVAQSGFGKHFDRLWSSKWGRFLVNKLTFLRANSDTFFDERFGNILYHFGASK